MNKDHTSDKKTNDLYQWLHLARTHWKFLLKITCIGLATGILIAFSLSKEYECSIFTVPESTLGRYGEESNVLSTSTSLGKTRVQDAIIPSLYPKVISSTPFLLSLTNIPVQPATSDTLMPLSDYLTKHQRIPWWGYIRMGISTAIGWALSPFKEEEKEPEETPLQSTEGTQGTNIPPHSRWNTTEMVRLSKRQAGILAAINARIQIGVDKKRRTITIHTRMQDPQVASTVADSVRSRIQEYVTAYRTQKERQHLAYTEELYRQAQKKYYQAQENYARYADQNRNLTQKSAQKELVNLQIERNIAYKEYTQTALQVQSAKMRVYKQRPVFAVIQPAITPLRPTSPAKLKIILACTILSFAAGLGRIWFKITFSQ